MKILVLLVSILCLSMTGASQEKILSGKVFNRVTKESLPGALVRFVDTNRQVYTDSLGLFSLSIPRKTHKVMFSSEGFKPQLFILKGPYRNVYAEIYLAYTVVPAAERIKLDTLWNKKKNSFTVLPFELIIGSIGFQYERLLSMKHAVGMHTSVYLFGWGYSMNTGGETNNYTGIKFAPYYRFYAKSKTDSRFFIEGKLMTGYFNMHPVLYRYSISSWFDIDYLTVERNLDFWTFGGGAALGWAIKFPKTENGIFNLSLGFQAFPLRADLGISLPSGYGYNMTYHLDEMWWYLGGPGSVLQIKLAYGGIF